MKFRGNGICVHGSRARVTQLLRDGDLPELCLEDVCLAYKWPGSLCHETHIVKGIYRYISSREIRRTSPFSASSFRASVNPPSEKI